jgi:hypothetical protein
MQNFKECILNYLQLHNLSYYKELAEVKMCLKYTLKSGRTVSRWC